MKHYELLQNYLSNLAVINVKLHNIHWNVVGHQFLMIHNLTEEIYDQFFEDYDAVAELLKMKGVMPLSSMKDYLAKASIEDLSAQEFSKKEALETLKGDLDILRNQATEIRNLADEEGDFETVGMFEEYVAFLSKNLWFVASMLK